MLDRIQVYLLQALDLRKGDLRRTLLMQVYLFIIISVLLFLKPVTNSLFLSKFGIEQIPYVFIAVAIVALLFTKFYVSQQSKLTFIKLHRAILFSIVLSLLIFFAGIRYPAIDGIIIYAFYIWVAIFALVATSQFWILSNIVFNPREARRVFGIIGAGGIAGGVFGGYIASLIVPFIGNEGLILLSAAFMALCFPLVNMVWKENHVVFEKDSLVVKKRRKVAQRFSFRRLSKSRHLILLAFLTGIGVLVSKLVDFQFQGIAAAKFLNEEQLTSFFGFWFSTFNVIGLFIQLFLTNRFLKILGVSKAQFILPGSFTITAVLLLFFPALWTVILVKGADGTLKQSIQRSINELLMLPIPSEIKEQSKTFIDVFVDSLATGISGLILIFLLSRSNVTSTSVSILIILSSAVWLGLAIVMKKEYFLAFKKQFLLDKEFEKTLVSDKNTIYTNINALLQANNEEQLIQTLNNLERLPRGLDYSKALSLLGHNNPEIRYRALQLRPFPNRKFKPQILELLINDPQLKIRVESYLYLLERNSNISEIEIRNALENIKSMGDASLLIAACIYFRDNEKLKHELDLEKHLSTLAQHFLVDFKDSTESSQKFHILKAIAFGRFSNLYHHIDEYLSSKVEEERRIALEASCFTLTRSYANKLIEALQDPVYEKTAANALLFYGEALMVIGHDVLSSKVLKNKAKAKFIGIFSGLGSQNVVNFLLDLLNQKSLRLRKEALTQLNIMKSKYKNLDFNKEMIYRRVEKEVRQIKSLLPHYFTLQHAFLDSNDIEKSEFLSSKKKVLRRSYMLLRKRFVTIFLLLGLEYEKKDVFDIYTGLMSKDELKRSYSLEFMEMFVDYKYGKILSPLLEVIILKKPSVEELAKLGIKLTTIELALVKMINYPDEKLQIAFLNLFEHKEMNQFSAVLNTPIKVKNQLIADRLERLRKQEIDKVY